MGRIIIHRILGFRDCKQMQSPRCSVRGSPDTVKTLTASNERKSAATTTCSYSHLSQMSNDRQQTKSNMYKANISSLFSSIRRQPLHPTAKSTTKASVMILKEMLGDSTSSTISSRDATAPMLLSIVWQLNVRPDKHHHHHHCHSSCPPPNFQLNTKSSYRISKQDSELVSTKSRLLGQNQHRLSLSSENNHHNSISHQRHSSIYSPAKLLFSPLSFKMDLVAQLMPTMMTNQLMSSKPVSILSNIVTRFASTLQGPNFGSIGSGIPIEDEQEMILSNSKGNKTVKINACGRVFTELARTKPHLYGTAPKGKGIDFQVQYYDSRDLIEATQRRPEAPVVCLLHGAPGHYKDFASLINYLTIKGIRVVAPNFPDYSATFEHSFRHSPSERLDFLLEFFKAINLAKIDMMIGHSSAVYTIFRLLDHSLGASKSSDDSFRPQIRSLGLFSVPSHELPPNMNVTPFRLFTLRLFDFPIMRPLILALIQTFVKIQGIQNRVDKNKIENLLIAASAVGYSEHATMKNHLKLIHQFRVPTFMLFGTSDRLIPEESFNRLKADLGVTSQDEVKSYDSLGVVRKDIVSPNELVDVSQFDDGGHYTFQRFPTQVNDDVYRFLISRVIKDSFESTKL